MACRLGIATRWSVASSTPQAASTNRSGANWCGEACGQGRAPVRLAALEWLCELDGVEAARRRARSDHDAAVKKWQPRPQPPPG